MELTKVFDILAYEGRVYVIIPYIDEGKIKRNTIYTDLKKAMKISSAQDYYSLGRIGKLSSWYTIFHFSKQGEIIDKDTIADGGNRHIRIFTDRESAKKALEEFEAQHAYSLTESIDKELKYLEKEREKLDAKIKELKKRKKECFNILTTSFIKKT